MAVPILNQPSVEERRYRATQVTLHKYREIMEEQLARLPRTLAPAELAALPEVVQVRDLLITLRTAEKQYEADIVFPQIARRAFIVTTYSAIEEHAGMFSDALHAFKSLPLRWNDLKGNTLDRLHTYAFKLASLPALAPTEWQRAKWLEQIRDCIVHANGNVAKSRDASSLRGLVGKVPGYGIDAQGHIRLHEAGGSFAWGVFSGLFNHLYKEANLPEVPLVLTGVGSGKTDAAT